MGYTLLNTVTFMLCSFLVMYLIYKPVMNKYAQTLEFKPSMLVFPYMLAVYAVGAIAAYFSTDLRDFVEPLGFFRMAVPLVLAAIIYASTLIFSRNIIYLTVALALGITIWMQPLGMGNIFNLAPIWARILVFVFALIFCLGSRIMNILPHIFILPNIVILAGLLLLSFLNATPLYIAICAAILLGVTAAYLSMNYYNVVIDLDEGACVAISYLICSLLLMNLGEFSFPSCIIFTLIFWAEIIVALYNRYFITHIGLLSENTNYYFAAQKYPLQLLASAIFKVGLVLLFISWFQLFAINSYSLILVALLIVIWLDSMVGRREATPTTFAEINRKFIADIKQNIQEAKKFFNPDNKDEK